MNDDLETDNTPMILGVCSNIAKTFGGDIFLIRMIVIFLIFLSGIIPGLIIYGTVRICMSLCSNEIDY